MGGMTPLDMTTLDVKINGTAVKQCAQALKDHLVLYDDECKIRDLLLAINCIDLTTLAGDDTGSNVARLCWRATHPVCEPLVDRLRRGKYLRSGLTTGAVCVYPLRVADCRKSFHKLNSTLPIASVVAGFPAGQGPRGSTLGEISFAIESGATEIDIVINRTHALTGQWQTLYEEIKCIADHCHKCGAHLKVILAYGELASLDNVYKASMCAMMAGTDFIKTSTGKESINAKLVYGLVMTRAIRDYYRATGRRVGLKPAGGLKEADDALCWIRLVRTQLGEQWLTNQLFRIGASSLLAQIEAQLYRLVFHREPTKAELSF